MLQTILPTLPVPGVPREKKPAATALLRRGWSFPRAPANARRRFQLIHAVFRSLDDVFLKLGAERGKERAVACHAHDEVRELVRMQLGFFQRLGVRHIELGMLYSRFQHTFHVAGEVGEPLFGLDQ